MAFLKASLPLFLMCLLALPCFADPAKKDHELVTELIKKKNWAELGKVLRVNKTISELVIVSQAIDEEGGKAIGEALKKSRTITSFELIQGKTTLPAQKAIALGVGANRSLKKLALQGNFFNDQSASAFATALTKNKSLE